MRCYENDLIKGAKGAARATGLQERDIYYLVQCNAIPYRKVGRLLYFSRSQLLASLRPETASRHDDHDQIGNAVGLMQ